MKPPSRMAVGLATSAVIVLFCSPPARAVIVGCECDQNDAGAVTGTISCWGQCGVTEPDNAIDLQFATPGPGDAPPGEKCQKAAMAADIAPDPICGPDGSSTHQWEVHGLTIPAKATHLKSTPPGDITCRDVTQLKNDCQLPRLGLGPATDVPCPPATLDDYRCGDAVMKAFASLTSGVLTCRRKEADEGFTDQQFDEKKCEASTNTAFETRLAYANTCSADVVARARGARDELLGTGPRSIQALSARIYCDPSSGRPLDATGPEAGWVPADTPMRSCANRTLENVTRTFKDVIRCRTLSAKAALDDHSFYSDCGQGRFTRGVLNGVDAGTCPSCLDVAAQDAMRGLAADVVKGFANVVAGTCKLAAVTCPRQNVIAREALCAEAYGGVMELTYEGATDWFFKESVTDVADAMKCSAYGGPIAQTSLPFQSATGVLTDRIVNHNGPPGDVAPCTDTTNQVIFAGPTEASVETCRFANVQAIQVSRDPRTVRTSQGHAVASCAY